MKKNSKNSEEMREHLRRLGFVRVDGLTEIGFRGERLIAAEDRWLGRYDDNNGRTVVVTPKGEIWLADGVIVPKEILVPNGKGAYVPCSNGEKIAFGDLLARVADPDWQPQCD